MKEITNTFEQSTKWLENLALEEINMDESGVINFHEQVSPEHFLEESSIDFMNTIRDLFDVYVNRFNEYRGGKNNQSQIKIFKISNTINDFMLFRNSLRLIFNRRSSDLISIGFMASNGEILPARLNIHDISDTTHEIKAHIGPFNNITWRFRGDIVNIESLTKHYLREFIRNSAR